MNTSYKAIAEEYTTWLGTLGYSESIIYSSKMIVHAFFEWLEEKQVQNISQLANSHISEYYSYLEIPRSICRKYSKHFTILLMPAHFRLIRLWHR